MYVLLLGKWGFSGGSLVRNPPANAGDVRDTSLIHELGRSLGEWHGNPLQYSYLGNPMERGAWQAAIYEVARVRHDLVTKPQES